MDELDWLEGTTWGGKEKQYYYMVQCRDLAMPGGAAQEGPGVPSTFAGKKKKSKKKQQLFFVCICLHFLLRNDFFIMKRAKMIFFKGVIPLAYSPIPCVC